MTQVKLNATQGLTISGSGWVKVADYGALSPDLPWAVRVRNRDATDPVEVIVPGLYGGSYDETPGAGVAGEVVAAGEEKHFSHRSQRLTGLIGAVYARGDGITVDVSIAGRGG